MMTFLMIIFGLVGVFGFLMTNTGKSLRDSVFRTNSDKYDVAPSIKRRASQARMVPVAIPVQQRQTFGKR
jgi:hypothetical protein